MLASSMSISMPVSGTYRRRVWALCSRLGRRHFDYRRISRTGDVSLRGGVRIDSLRTRHDIQVLQAVAGSQAGHVKQRVRGWERRGDDSGSESTPGIIQYSLAIADDVDHSASVRCNWLPVGAWTLAIEGSDWPEFVLDGFPFLGAALSELVWIGFAVLV
jgi:hypothetical protein